MQKQEFTECIRCGKIRIFQKKWKDRGENGKGTLMTYEQSVCPDQECQKIVDAKFQEMRDRRELMENRKKSVVLAKKN
ncbi:MAG: hypothetical protein NUV69_04755 [Candidatus Curtissbacteria bacterium]|nr:hypothetical protein [Candidatus Curtissbacteria bacterium]